jgi:hypothetical protein
MDQVDDRTNGGATMSRRKLPIGHLTSGRRFGDSFLGVQRREGVMLIECIAGLAATMALILAFLPWMTSLQRQAADLHHQRTAQQWLRWGALSMPLQGLQPWQGIREIPIDPDACGELPAGQMQASCSDWVDAAQKVIGWQIDLDVRWGSGTNSQQRQLRIWRLR